MSEQQERVELNKSLSPANVWALALGSIIGFGCFIMPTDLLGKAGPLGATLGIVIGALIMVIIGTCYGFMVKQLPVSGGEFTYAYKEFGRKHAYLCGWFLSLGYLSIVPLNATALAVLAKFIAPDFFTRGYLYTVAGWDVYIGEVILASVVILVFGIFNIVGVEEVGKVQLLMVGVLVGSVLFLGIGSVTDPLAKVSNLAPLFNEDVGALAGIAAILAISPWLFVGFGTIPQAAEEYNFTPDKGKKLIYWAIILGALMYVIVLLSTAAVFPWTETLSANHTWATGTAMKTTMGTFGMVFLVVGVVMAILTGINGFFMATSRLLFGMARAKVLPSWFLKVNPKTKTPTNAVIFVMLIALIAPWCGRQVINWIVDMASLGTTFGYAYTCFGAYLLAKRSNNLSLAEVKSSKTFGLVGGLFSIGFMLLLCVPGSPGFMKLPSWIMLGAWIAMGLVFYFSKSKEYNSLSKAELDYLIFGKESNDNDSEIYSPNTASL